MDFFSLPREIRKNIYERCLSTTQALLLFKDRGSEVVEIFAPGKPLTALPLLRANRRVQQEACAVLYGKNRFTFMDTTDFQDELLRAFLRTIGAQNTNLLTHIGINFPALDLAEAGLNRPHLTEGSLRTLGLLRERCASLRTLDTVVQDDNSAGLIESDNLDPLVLGAALSQVRTQLVAIPSLEKIVVAFYTEGPSPFVKERLEGFGWIVRKGR